MKLQSLSARAAGRLHGFGQGLVLFLASSVILAPGVAIAQILAPGEPVAIPGIEIPGVGNVGEVPGRFGRPPGPAAKGPAVLILHGAGGVDGRGAFYAMALQEAGIATLELTMFAPGGQPQAPRENLPHAAAALKWLAAQPGINDHRLGVMGFSWGGMIALLTASELVQERLGKEVPKPAAFAPFYPNCTPLARNWLIPQNPFYNAHARMSATPMLIQVGTRDENEDSERACSAFVATWPSAAREYATVRYVEGAGHSFDLAVATNPSLKVAVEARDAVVGFFVKNLKP
jgi:dienelactone hydrolase